MSSPSPKANWAALLSVLGRAAAAFSRRFGHTKPQRLCFLALLALPALRRRALAAGEAGFGVGTVCGLDGLFVLEAAAFALAERFEEFYQAAAQHPDYAGSTCPPDPQDPPVVAVYRHRAGRDGKTESYLVAPFSECISEYGWGRSRMGELVGFDPVTPDMRCDARRIGFVNNSPKTRGSRGFFARQTLKALLPAEAKHAVGLARKAYRQRKTSLAGLPSRLVRVDGQKGRPTHSVDPDGTRVALPDGYHEKSKRDLFFDQLDPAVLALLDCYLSREDFWAAATGALYPDELDDRLLVDTEAPTSRWRNRRHARARVERDRLEQQGQGRLELA
jgi:hypothetical protein